MSSLKEIEKIPSEFLVSTLDNRKIKEMEFHDKDRDENLLEDIDENTHKKRYGNRKFYSITEPSNSFLFKWIEKEAQGNIFLDYCCGNGGLTIKAARANAMLAIGIDISPISISNCRKEALKAVVSKNSYFVQADAENTRLPDNSIDRIVCSGVLHHLDLHYSFPELHRILKPGGKIMCIEALDYNPFIKLYRKMTPGMRTEWEKDHILSLKDVHYAENFFKVTDIQYWHILSILSPYISPLAPFLVALDNLLTKIPLIQLMSWIFTFELEKRR